MPNYTPGQDQGTILRHPVFDNPLSLEDGGPYKVTYNGFIRVNTGAFPNDETGDSARNAWHYYLQNLDLTVSKNDCDAAVRSNSVVLRDVNGNINANDFIAGDYSLSTTNGFTGVASGGRF